MGGANFMTAGPIPDAQNDGIKQTNFVVGFSGANPGTTVIAGVTGKRISVHAAQITQGQSNGGVGQLNETTLANATITTQYQWFGSANTTSVFFQYSQYPWFTCAPGNSLVIAQTNGATVGYCGILLYMQG
jgi:hypothetical protein